MFFLNAEVIFSKKKQKTLTNKRNNAKYFQKGPVEIGNFISKLLLLNGLLIKTKEILFKTVS